jgi:hypothetical protein
MQKIDTLYKVIEHGTNVTPSMSPSRTPSRTPSFAPISDIPIPVPCKSLPNKSSNNGPCTCDPSNSKLISTVMSNADNIIWSCVPVKLKKNRLDQ